MRKLIFVGVAAALAFGTGCQRSSDAEDVQAAREDVMQEREELAQTETGEREELGQDLGQMEEENQQELAERRQQAEESIQAEREEVAEAEQELGETRQEYQQERAEEMESTERDTAMGGSGEAGAMSLTGTVEKKAADKLTLNTGSGMRELIVDTDTEITHMGNAVEVKDLQPGAEIRASYTMEAGKMVADRVEVLKNAAK